MYIAVVEVSQGRVTKHAAFESKSEADAHIVEFDGVGVYHQTEDFPILELVLDNGTFRRMTTEERAAVRAAAASSKEDAAIAGFDNPANIVRAVSLALLSEINAIRSELDLQPRTESEFKAVVVERLRD